jgi:hypothetical protein
MEQITLLGANLVSPPVIAFLAGLMAVWTKSDLKFPNQVYQGLTIYLLISIGYKGGSALAATSLVLVLKPLGATLLIGTVIPVGVYFVIRRFLRLDNTNAAAMAAHYGSVSAVTFMACLVFLDSVKMEYEAFMPAIMAIMEFPAILAALVLARLGQKEERVSFGSAIREVLAGKSLILLCCGLLAGLMAGVDGRARLDPFLIAPFYGALMLFLLEMGLVAGEKLKDARVLGRPLFIFALLAPVVQGSLGLFLASDHRPVPRGGRRLCRPRRERVLHCGSGGRPGGAAAGQPGDLRYRLARGDVSFQPDN